MQGAGALITEEQPGTRGCHTEHSSTHKKAESENFISAGYFTLLSSFITQTSPPLCFWPPSHLSEPGEKATLRAAQAAPAPQTAQLPRPQGGAPRDAAEGRFRAAPHCSLLAQRSGSPRPGGERARPAAPPLRTCARPQGSGRKTRLTAGAGRSPAPSSAPLRGRCRAQLPSAPRGSRTAAPTPGTAGQDGPRALRGPLPSAARRSARRRRRARPRRAARRPPPQGPAEGWGGGERSGPDGLTCAEGPGGHVGPGRAGPAAPPSDRRLHGARGG